MNKLSEEYKPWLEYPEIWSTESKFMTYLRGCVRRGFWEKHPVKLKFLNDSAILVVNTNPRSKKRFPEVKKWECNICKCLHSNKNVEVDHKVGEHSLRSINQLNSFILGIISVTSNDLQILCKPCHKAKSYAERNGIDIKDAIAEKQAIAICKEKKDKEWLIEHGVTPASSGPKRRRQIVEYLKGENDA